MNCWCWTLFKLKLSECCKVDYEWWWQVIKWFECEQENVGGLLRLSTNLHTSQDEDQHKASWGTLETKALFSNFPCSFTNFVLYMLTFVRNKSIVIFGIAAFLDDHVHIFPFQFFTCRRSTLILFSIHFNSRVKDNGKVPLHLILVNNS